MCNYSKTFYKINFTLLNEIYRAVKKNACIFKIDYIIYKCLHFLKNKKDPFVLVCLDVVKSS